MTIPINKSRVAVQQQTSAQAANRAGALDRGQGQYQVRFVSGIMGE